MFKILIASRRLFRNWLSAAIKYYLIKHGLVRGNITVKCDGNVCLSPRIYGSIVNAYYDGLLKNFRYDDSLVGRLCGAIDFVVKNDGAFLKMPDGVLLTLSLLIP